MREVILITESMGWRPVKSDFRLRHWMKCFAIDSEAKIIHTMLNQIIVGKVLIVEVATNAALDSSANM